MLRSAEAAKGVAIATWTGQGFTFDWSEPKNWDTGAPPGEDDEMVVPGGSTYDAPVPPAGTKVKVLTISGGGLQSRMFVKEKFTWSGGYLSDGLDLGPLAQVLITGGGRALGGDLTTTLNSLVDAKVGMYEGARLTNGGTLQCSGNNRLSWTAAANPFFHNDGLLNLVVGSLTLDDVIGMIKGQITILPGSELVVSSFTVPSFVLGASVAGGGTFRVRAGGVWVSDKSTFAAGTTFELDENGRVEAHSAAARRVALTGPIPGTQGLMVDGRFHWSAGAIVGNVTVKETGVFVLDGPGQHEHADGTVRILGSGAVVGPTNIAVGIGQWQVAGDLLLQGPLFLDRGNAWSLEVSGPPPRPPGGAAGNLRVDGSPGDVRLGNFPLRNLGSIFVEAGTLRLDQQPDRISQSSTGRLTVAAGARLIAGDLTIEQGALAGAGTISINGGQGTLALGTGQKPLGTGEKPAELEPGIAPDPGRLTIEGSCRLGPRARSISRIGAPGAAAEFGRLATTGSVELGGELLVQTHTQFAPQVGKVMEIVSTTPPHVLTGRFQKATLPQPAAGRFLRVSYSRRGAQLLTATNATGVDAEIYPGDAVVKALVKLARYRWVGYYLYTEYRHTNKSWLGKRKFLVGQKLGIAVVYFGGHRPNSNGVPGGLTIAQAGAADAQDAVAKTAAEGFPPGSWIYMDIEWRKEGVTVELASYVEAWATEMLRIGSYVPAVYCPSQEVARLAPGLTKAFQAAGRDDRTRFWVATLSRPIDTTLPPAASGTPEAVIWQQEFTGKVPKPHEIERKADGTPFVAPDGKPWAVDRSISVFADPSAP